MVDAGDDEVGRSPRSARAWPSRTQSTGVPSVAKPIVPSSNGVFCTHSGRRVVIIRAIAERLPSGATTSSPDAAMASTHDGQRCSPSASMPSSLVSSTCMRWAPDAHRRRVKDT